MAAQTLVLLYVVAVSGAASAEKLAVNGKDGNNTFTAVFDAVLGERISAVSSAVSCDLALDETGAAASGTCSVPLTAIVVDNQPKKTAHFQEWATNAKGKPADCTFTAKFTGVKLQKPLVAEQPVPFSGAVTFTVCGRTRDDNGAERVEGNAILLPAGSYDSTKTVRIRAKIEGFNRERYKIGPSHTEGWLAKVQSLAKVVAEVGTIELNLFASSTVN